MSETIHWFKLSPEVRNILIHEKVMGRSLDITCPGVPSKSGLCSQCAYVGNDDHLQIVPGYTTSMDWAWLVAEGYDEIELSKHVATRYRCQLYKGSNMAHATAKTAPEAICIATLILAGYTVVNEV